ncbi:hypothetical protein SAMN05428981_11238 [Bacillus sp. OV194]|nr:hypothetical protein SAMN05428981_11238 [Bacillus sp. OV194]
MPAANLLIKYGASRVNDRLAFWLLAVRHALLAKMRNLLAILAPLLAVRHSLLAISQGLLADPNDIKKLGMNYIGIGVS